MPYKTSNISVPNTTGSRSTHLGHQSTGSVRLELFFQEWRGRPIGEREVMGKIRYGR
tara:strand:- start:961 stop:1131 length:171 start_codon:yes stop_codon:yes gene_type:complete